MIRIQYSVHKDTPHWFCRVLKTHSFQIVFRVWIAATLVCHVKKMRALFGLDDILCTLRDPEGKEKKEEALLVTLKTQRVSTAAPVCSAWTG